MNSALTPKSVLKILVDTAGGRPRAASARISSPKSSRESFEIASSKVSTEEKETKSGGAFTGKAKLKRAFVDAACRTAVDSKDRPPFGRRPSVLGLR